MAETIRIAMMVGTPLALLGLLAVLLFYGYSRYLKSSETKLKLLPEADRAKALDDYLTRYEITGENLTRERKYQLIRLEIEKKFALARTRYRIAALVFLVSFLIAAGAYVAHLLNPAPAPSPHASTATSLMLRLEDDSSESDDGKGPERATGMPIQFTLSNPLSGLAIVDTVAVDVLDVIPDECGSTQALVASYKFKVLLNPEKRGPNTFAKDFKYAPGEVDRLRLLLDCPQSGFDFFVRIVVKWYDAATKQSRELISQVIVVRLPSSLPLNTDLAKREKLYDKQNTLIDQRLAKLNADFPAR